MVGWWEDRLQGQGDELRQATVEQTSQWLSSVSIRQQAAIQGHGLGYGAPPLWRPVNTGSLAVEYIPPAVSFQGEGHRHLAVNATQDVLVLSKHVLATEPWSLQKVCLASCPLCFSRQAALPQIGVPFV